MAMITPDWVRMMARYNRWQNQCVQTAMESLDPAALTEPRGAFWGSILGTANHLLWGDTMWMSRLDGGPGPEVGMADAPQMTPTLGAWSAARFQADGRLTLWAKSLSSVRLAGSITWFSGAAGREITAPLGPVVTHVFNHQTHHRGQIHAMLTAAGAKTDDTDLFLMPGLL